jgi:DNA-binding NarL/FixJ family response regulator
MTIMRKSHADDGTVRIDLPRTTGEGAAVLRIVVVDQDEIRLRRLSAALAAAGHREIERCARLEELHLPEDEPAVVLVGVGEGDEAGAALDQPSPLVHVVALVADARDARRALARGADSALLHDSDAATITATVQLAGSGFAVRPLAIQARSTRRALTAREKQVLALVVMGFGNRDIAAKLRVTDRTVKSHLSSVFRKLGVTSRHEATAAVLDSETGTGLGVVGLT